MGESRLDLSSHSRTFFATIPRHHSGQWYWSLASTKYAGVACAVRRASCRLPVAVKRSFVSPSGEEELPTDPLAVEEGRILILKWKDFHLLNTYVPNTKWTEDGRRRRRRFDAEVLQFCAQYGGDGGGGGGGGGAAAGSNSNSSNKTQPPHLAWVGDMNSTLSDGDMSHPRFYREGVYQWKKDILAERSENEEDWGRE